MTAVLLGIGSNIEPIYHLRAAAHALRLLDSQCQFSSVYETEPVGFVGDNVFNLVALLHTALSLEALLAKLKAIEITLGRVPCNEKTTARTIDIDLLTFGERCQTSHPRLPREDIYRYAFVLLPLAQLCPARCIPGTQQTYAEAWRNFTGNQVIVSVDSFSLL